MAVVLLHSLQDHACDCVLRLHLLQRVVLWTRSLRRHPCPRAYSWLRSLSKFSCSAFQSYPGSKESLIRRCHLRWTLRVFSSLAGSLLGPLLAGSAPRGDFTTGDRHLLGSPSTYPVVPSDVLWPVTGQVSTRSAGTLNLFSCTSNSG